MSGPKFFQTGMGRQFYEGTLPRLVQQATRIADGIERLTSGVERLSSALEGAVSRSGETSAMPDGAAARTKEKENGR